MAELNIRVEYEATPIRHIAAQCPNCRKWFNGREITEQELSFSHHIYHAQFKCPLCGRVFGADECIGYANVNVVECGSSTEVYKDCLRRKEVWE